MKLSDPDLLKTAEPIIIIIMEQGFGGFPAFNEALREVLGRLAQVRAAAQASRRELVRPESGKGDTLSASLATSGSRYAGQMLRASARVSARLPGSPGRSPMPPSPMPRSSRSPAAVHPWGGGAAVAPTTATSEGTVSDVQCVNF
jgi:hypothetical protein